MKKVFAYALIGAILAVAAACGRPAPKVDPVQAEEMSAEVEEMKAQMPIDLGPMNLIFANFDKVSGRMDLVYQFKSVFNGQIFNADEIKKVSPALLEENKKMMVQSPEVRSALSKGISYHYTYNSPTGEKLFELDLTPDDLK